MLSRQKSWDLRPFSEYFYEQAEGRKNFRYLYYCKNCVKNFDAPIRVNTCKFCSEESLIELPKDRWPTRRELMRKASRKPLFQRKSKEAVPMGEKFDFATRFRMAMIYYFGNDVILREKGHGR